jgi:hypothetical protein
MGFPFHLVTSRCVYRQEDCGYWISVRKVLYDHDEIFFPFFSFLSSLPYTTSDFLFLPYFISLFILLLVITPYKFYFDYMGSRVGNYLRGECSLVMTCIRLFSVWSSFCDRLVSTFYSLTSWSGYYFAVCLKLLTCSPGSWKYHIVNFGVCFLEKK